ncbi:hypothetical protein QJS10_CPA03g01248 [Acorus calamus]|uniref:HTH myb-type domain-containing protein n=1 Tax=Acorus calamus TaxID=4465 RepID=A0AAV9F9X6_ACOCL|nr:hypothetical protein QJS10_CPA03g01248 [Acorus calamus]
MRFMEGLQALGRGEWAGIARDYVVTRNTTQVASHAQKYFLYQLKNAGKQRRGSSIFDLPPPPPPPPQLAPQRQTNNVENPTPVRVRIPFWMHIGVSSTAPNPIRPRPWKGESCLSVFVIICSVNETMEGLLIDHWLWLSMFVGVCVGNNLVQNLISSFV